MIHLYRSADEHEALLQRALEALWAEGCMPREIFGL